VLCLAATPGGHLDLLLALRACFEPYDRVWVVAEGDSAEALRRDGEAVRVLPRFHGLSPRNTLLAARSLRPALAERPMTVVTSGSGSVVPFCVAARAGGARIIFIETMARVLDGSDAGSVLSRIAAAVLVQWPELLRVYPDAAVGRPALLEGVDGDRAPRHDGEGTFAAVGTHIDPFDRMLAAVDDAVGRAVLPAPGIAQAGVATYRAEHIETTPFLPPHEIDARIERARYVVCHAGSGIVARTLAAGRRPLVMARLHRYGEHVDDHQLQLAAKLGEAGLVVPVEGRIEPHHLELADARLRPATSISERPSLAALLTDALRRLGPPPQRAG
jgi:UDP-N-acetylglucosamine--N-acetylmuramyl-(pentapeptide) pyrophosphoryl-undecaprenol N-acetylglucosamine transferase